MSIAKGLSLRLFLEGEEVPVISASVTSTINAPASASIQIIPLDEAHDFKPRTMVHLFFLDEVSETSSLDKDYKCLFVGEIVGFNYIQTPEGRGFVLQCLDHSSYWDTAHATAIEYGSQSNLFFNTSALLGSDPTIFDDIVSHAPEKLISWLNQKPLTEGLKELTGLTAGIVRIMEALGGVLPHHRGINDFFTVAELRCRLLNQIASEEQDDTAKKILKNKVLEDWLSNNLQSLGQQVTFRDIIKMLLNHIYYETVPNPTPKWEAAVKGRTKFLKQAKVNIKTSGTVLSIQKQLETELEVIRALVQLGLTKEDAKKKIILILNDFRKTSLDLSFVEGSSIVSAKVKQIISRLEALKNSDGIDTSKDLSSIPNTISEALQELSNLKFGQKVVPAHNTIVGATQQRLKTQIIRPDCWFASPPRCNVIFPEQYTQLSYDRTWITEATRTLIQMSNFVTQFDTLLSTKIVAPTLGSQSRVFIAGSGGEDSYRKLMQHEFHTGIVLKSEWMPDSAVVNRKVIDPLEKAKVAGEREGWTKKVAEFHFFKYRFAPRTLNLSGRFNPYLVCGFPGAVILKPLIINDLSPSEGQDLSDFVENHSSKAPNQLVGMIVGISHTIDQSGATTSVSMTHVRKHKGTDDDFLDAVKDKKQKEKRKIHIAVPLDLQTISDGNNSKLLEFLVSLTPQSSSLGPSTVTKVSTEQKTLNVNSVEAINVTVRKEVIISKQEDSPTRETTITFNDKTTQVMNVPKIAGKKGVGSKGLMTGTIVAVEVTDSSIFRTSAGNAFSGVIVHEEREITIDSSIPFEDMVRPAWFSDIYANKNIGSKVYDSFFGCGAVVDDLAIVGIGQPDSQVITVSPDTDPTFIDDYVAKLDKQKSKNSIERSLNVLAYTYYKIKSKNLGIDDFIRQYIKRPIATKENILGSSDLEFKISGNEVSLSNPNSFIGFHTMAVHPQIVDLSKDKRLLGLKSDPETGIKRIGGHGKAEPIPLALDVRYEKKQKILQYKEALNTHAFHG
jgi:hypothetical protein